MLAQINLSTKFVSLPLSAHTAHFSVPVHGTGAALPQPPIHLSIVAHATVTSAATRRHTHAQVTPLPTTAPRDEKQLMRTEHSGSFWLVGEETGSN